MSPSLLLVVFASPRTSQGSRGLPRGIGADAPDLSRNPKNSSPQSDVDSIVTVRGRIDGWGPELNTESEEFGHTDPEGGLDVRVRTTQCGLRPDRTPRRTPRRASSARTGRGSTDAATPWLPGATSPCARAARGPPPRRRGDARTVEHAVDHHLPTTVTGATKLHAPLRAPSTGRGRPAPAGAPGRGPGRGGQAGRQAGDVGEGVEEQQRFGQIGPDSSHGRSPGRGTRAAREIRRGGTQVPSLHSWAAPRNARSRWRAHAGPAAPSRATWISSTVSSRSAAWRASRHVRPGERPTPR